MVRFLKNSLIFLFALKIMSCSVFGIHSYETPNYKVIHSEGPFEVRMYESYIVAKTTIANSNFSDSQSPAFKRLASYIFGENKAQKKIAMTGPVTQQPYPSSQIDMTAPVTQRPQGEGAWEMAFMMPSKWTLETLPEPESPEIQFAKVPEQLMAAIRYSWFGTEKRNQKKAEELKAWVKQQTNYAIISPPIYAGYNPPWTLPFFRKNEILFELKNSGTLE